MSVFSAEGGKLRSAMARGPTVDAWVADSSGEFPEGVASLALVIGRRLRAIPAAFRPSCCVVDRRANAITCAWEVSADRAPSPDAEAYYRERIARAVESYLQDSRAWDERLLRRPSLLLLFVMHPVSRREGESCLAAAYSEFDARAGDRLPDVLVRSVAADAWVEETQRFHLRFLDTPPPTETVPEAQLQRVLAQIESACNAIGTDGDGPELLHRAAFAAATLPQTFEAERAAPPDPGGDAARSDASALPVLLSAKIKVRRWCERPLQFPVHSLTFVASGNGGGKTTLAEALCAAHHGGPRLRTVLPEQSTEWTNGGERAEVVLTTLVPRTSDGFPYDAWIPLFADDADLSTGRVGDTSLFALSGRPGVGAVVRSIAALTAKLEDLRRRLTELITPPVSDDEAGADEFDLRGPAVGELLARIQEDSGKQVDAVRSKLSELQQRRAEAEEALRRTQAEAERLAGGLDALILQQQASPPPENVNPEQGEEHLKALAEKRGVQQQRLDEARGKARAAAATLTEIIASELEEARYLPEAEARHARITEGYVPSGDLVALYERKEGDDEDVEVAWSRRWQSVWLSPTGRALLAEPLREHGRRLLRRLDAERDGTVRALLQALTTPDERRWADRVADELRRFLSTDVALDVARRGNTADQVRQAHAERLAWSICARRGRLAALMIDEPTLAQDEPSSARVMAQLVRVARYLELATQDAPASSWSIAEETVAFAPTTERHEPSRTDKSTLLPWVPPPPLVMLTYRERALGMLFCCEATLATPQVRRSLRRLVAVPVRRLLTEVLLRKFDASSAADGSRGAHHIALELMGSDFLEALSRVERDAVSLDFADAESGARHLGLASIATALAQAKTADSSERPRVERRVLLWLIRHGLVPLVTSLEGLAATARGASLQTLRAKSVGDAVTVIEGVHLRRLAPLLDALPELPANWDNESGRSSEPAAPIDEPGEGEHALGDVSRGERTPDAGIAAASPSAPLPAPTDPARGVAPTPSPSPHGLEAAAPPTRVIRMDSAGTTDRSSSRPWSVSAEAPAVLRASIVAACDHVGLLFVTDDTADVTVAVTETSTDDELAPTRWHVIAHRGASKVASSFDSGDDLAAEAARAALRVLVQSGALLDEGTVPIVLASYSKSAAPRSGRYFRILAEAERPDHEDWEATVGVGLERLRQTLQEDFRTRSVTLWLECTLALATRAGLVFHDGTGFSIRCETLGRSLTGAVNSKDSVFDEPVVRVTHDGASAGEVHLLLSASQDVFGLYGKWRWSPVGVAGRVVHLMPSGGAPSSNVIADTRDVLAWAAVARRAITAAQRDLNTEGHAERTTRVFIAGPAAMAVALGRQLNSLGTVILMDRDKRTDAYIPRFTVRT